MAPLLVAAALVLFPSAALGTSERGSPAAATRPAGDAARGAGSNRAVSGAAHKRRKTRPAHRKRRRRAPPKAIANVSGALPDSMLSLGTGLDLRGGCNLPECGLHARFFGEREVEGLVRRADDLYAGAVLREGVGFWLWARPSAERLTLSPLASPGDHRYGLFITGCFE